MQYLDGPISLKIAALAALATDGGALPDLVREKITEALAQASPVPPIVAAMEGLYAARETLPPVWLTLGGQAAAMVEENDFHGKAARAGKLHQIFRRCLGERTTPNPIDDPEVDEAYLPADPSPAA